jgi:polar amino acid transport system substrate-binding protein
MDCGASIAALATALTLASGEPTVIATEAPFPPYTYYDAATGITGFDRDVGDEVCARAHLTCEWVNTRFDKLIPGVMSGEFDIVMGGMAASAERRRLVDFTQTYSDSGGSSDFVGRTGAPEPADALIGVQSGTIHEQHLKDQNYRFVTYGTERDILDALVAGKVELAFGAFNVESVTDFFAANSIDWLYQEDIGDDGVAMAVCKGNTALLDQLDAALTGMITDGTLNTISDRWF